MSRSPTENPTYFDAVQDYFLERTGRGLILSSRDLELLLDWRECGASATVVCQGIDEAVESLDGAPRDLHACKRFVEPRLDPSAVPLGSTSTAAPSLAEGDGSVGGDDEEWESALARLNAAQEQTSRPELRDAYARARARLVEAQQSNADPYRVFCEVDDWLVTAVFEALPEDERRLIELEVEGRCGAHLAMMTEEAREQTRRACVREILGERLDLLQLARQ